MTLLFGPIRSSLAAGRQFLYGHVPPVVARLQPLGQLPGTNVLNLAIGLPLRDGATLEELLRQLYDPASTNFHKFLLPVEFAARFGPTEQDYQAVQDFARSNGLTVTGTYTNCVVLDIQGSVTDVERAFQVTLRTYRHPTEARNFFAPDTEPSLPANLRVTGIEGLSDYSLPRRADRRVSAAKARPLSFNGSGPHHEYAGNDFRNAYVPGVTNLDGTGQTVALLEYSDYYKVDVTNYENIVGALNGTTNYVPLTNVVVGGFTPGTGNNGEVALDIEMAIAMAPKLSRVIVYEKNSVSSTLLNRIATDNLAKQVSSSWMVGSWSSSLAAQYDTILTNMAAQGQSFFQASGDSDAYTGSQPLDSGTTVPADSPYATIVGGTSLTMNGYGASWSSETVWNYNSVSGFANWGSGGGISAYYPIPSWQINVNMATNGGSSTYRNIPDVALTADNIFVSCDDGDDTGTNYFMGTSCAAPLWAGFCALVNQQSTAANPTNYVGFLNPALYAIATNASYNSCFHDITISNNIGTNTAGFFYATNGYDLCTGLGTPAGTNLINALAPTPYFLTQPSSQTNTAGGSAVFSVTAGGLPPFGYRWLFNGTNLPAGANVSGTAGNVLTLTSVTAANAGSYRVVVTNNFGSITSSVATLTVNLLSPTLTLTSPANPSGYNNSLNFTASLNPATATGTVQFLTNGFLFDTETPAAGSATSVPLATLPRGTNSIAARYSGDVNDLPATNTLSQVVTNHPPVVTAFYTNRYTGLSLKIPVSTLANNWSDADGDTLSLAGISVSTNGVTVTNSAGTLVYYDGNNVADLFTCTISDGWGGTNFQNVYIAIMSLPTNAVPAFTSVFNSNGTLQLNLAGMSGLTYVLQATTNLISSGSSWLPLATNVPDTNGFWQFSDTITNNPRRFYRLKLVP
ncbi:MAG: protease pro-enzyme activation domain-containing protein [Verrucomicrobiota bacterium]